MKTTCFDFIIDNFCCRTLYKWNSLCVCIILWLVGSAWCGYYDSHPLMLLAVIHLFALSLYKQSKVYCPVFSINETYSHCFSHYWKSYFTTHTHHTKRVGIIDLKVKNKNIIQLKEDGGLCLYILVVETNLLSRIWVIDICRGRCVYVWQSVSCSVVSNSLWPHGL